MPVSFDELLREPPTLKTKTAELPDGRKYTLHQLPMSALIRSNDLAKTAVENAREVDLREFGRIAVQAMLGREPDEEELNRFQQGFSKSVIETIYVDAVRFSQIDEESVAAEKNG